MSKEKLSRDKIIELLNNTNDLNISINPANSEGHDIVDKSTSEVILTRADLEKLVRTNKNIAFSSFHSSGITNTGSHSSS